jgi:hypothetical protein
MSSVLAPRLVVDPFVSVSSSVSILSCPPYLEAVSSIRNRRSRPCRDDKGPDIIIISTRKIQSLVRLIPLEITNC